MTREKDEVPVEDVLPDSPAVGGAASELEHILSKGRFRSSAANPSIGGRPSQMSKQRAMQSEPSVHHRLGRANARRSR